MSWVFFVRLLGSADCGMLNFPMFRTIPETESVHGYTREECLSAGRLRPGGWRGVPGDDGAQAGQPDGSLTAQIGSRSGDRRAEIRIPEIENEIHNGLPKYFPSCR